LSVTPGPWTVDHRARVLDWFDVAAAHGGGNSYFGYVVAIRNRFVLGFSPNERGALKARIMKPLVQDAPRAPVAPRPFAREWKLDEIAALAAKDSGPRDLENGRRIFGAANCYGCHRIAGEGSSVGPDLTGVGGRYGVRDILQSIVEPSRVISDQYQQMEFDSNGRTIVGRVTNITGDSVIVSTDMLDPMKEVTLKRDEIDRQEPSKTSIMPEGLLNTFNENEILDLLGYLRAGGVVSPKVPAAGSASK
jgi:putative heme-binding domain-containing protein